MEHVFEDPGRTANDLPDLCWYEKDQDFNEVNTNKIVNFDVINGIGTSTSRRLSRSRSG